MRLSLLPRVLVGLSVFAPASIAQVTGFVLDATTQAPLVGADVREQATSNFTTVAADGSFTLSVAPGTTITIAASLPGYWNKGQVVQAPAMLLMALTKIPAGDDATVDFTSSTNCNFCHQDAYSQWFNAPMSRSGENTWLHDVYAGNGTANGFRGFVYTRDSKHKNTNTDGDCASCHAPVLAAKFPGLETPLDDPASPSPEQAAGVACDLCHRMESVDLVNSLHFPGVVPQKVTFARPPGVGVPPIMYGPYKDAVFEAPAMQPAYNPLFESSMVCAVCHQDANDHDDDGDYEDAGSVAHQNTYVEWLNSSWANPGPGFSDCVDCHMPTTGETTVCIFGPNRDPDTVHAHSLRGTTRDYLQNSVEMRVIAKRAGTDIAVKVSLINIGAGHAVPTGSDFRNLILLVTAKDALGNDLSYTGTQVVHPLGGVGPAQNGNFAGLPGKLFGRINTDGTSEAQFFSEAVGIVSDNRLAPFQPDVSNYTFAAPAGAVTVNAKLVYRRAWRNLAKTKNWRLDGHGAPLADFQPPHFGELMEQDSVIVP